MNSKEFRSELEKIMPGYSWTVHRHSKFLDVEGAPPPPLAATGIQSSGSNRLSTLEVVRHERDGRVSYVARSAGYGTKARWLSEYTDGTLARALRGLQEHYEGMANTYRSHALALENARQILKAKTDSSAERTSA